MARKVLSQASGARNGYPSRLLPVRPSWRYAMSENPVVAIWEGEMDVASGRKDPVTSTEKQMRCRHCGTPLQQTLIDLGI